MTTLTVQPEVSVSLSPTLVVMLKTSIEYSGDELDLFADRLRLRLRNELPERFGVMDTDPLQHGFDFYVTAEQGSITTTVKWTIGAAAAFLIFYGGIKSGAKELIGDVRWLYDQAVEIIEDEATRYHYGERLHDEVVEGLIFEVDRLVQRAKRGELSRDAFASECGILLGEYHKMPAATALSSFMSYYLGSRYGDVVQAWTEPDGSLAMELRRDLPESPSDPSQRHSDAPPPALRPRSRSEPA